MERDKIRLNQAMVSWKVMVKLGSAMASSISLCSNGAQLMFTL